MIIPNDDDQDQPIPAPKKPAKSTRVSAVKVVPIEYQQKVNQMLSKMAIDQVIRIGRVCKPDNQPQFIQAIKNFIVSTPHGGGVLFTDDFKSFKRHRMFHEHEKSVARSVGHVPDPIMITQRNGLIRWHRINQRTFDNAPFTIQGSTYTDPNKAINNHVNTSKHSKTGSAPFNAAINHLQTIKRHLQS
jgi:hypothetical protein